MTGSIREGATARVAPPRRARRRAEWDPFGLLPPIVERREGVSARRRQDPRRSCTMRAEAAEWNARSVGYLPGLVGMEALDIAPGRVRSRLTVRPDLLAPNGYLHAATVIALADTSCGYGTMASLPEGSHGFTTIELKANFLGTARDGGLACEATLIHGGRSTQVWDARVTDEATGRAVALFRCTQMVLYAR